MAPARRLGPLLALALAVAGVVTAPAFAADPAPLPAPSVHTDEVVHHHDPVTPPAERGTRKARAATPAAPFPLEDTFELHSMPGADKVIFLDFDGADVSGTEFADTKGLAADQAGWDVAGDGAAVTDADRTRIQQIWAIVSEDFAPWQVDVTAEQPTEAALIRNNAADPTYGVHVLFSGDDSTWNQVCGRGCAGVAASPSFDRIGKYYKIAWVFPAGGGNYAPGAAFAASHEVGHTLGLAHHGKGTGAEKDYYKGNGLWAPIMGNGPAVPVSQWSDGGYPEATNSGQDDLKAIGTYLAHRIDESDGDIEDAVPLPAPGATAYITGPDDVDSYFLGTCQEGAQVDVRPAAIAPNLDIVARLKYDGPGGWEDTANPDTALDPGDVPTATGMGASLTVDGSQAPLPVVLTVDGAGYRTWADGYSDYGSIGAYTVDVTGCDGQYPDAVPRAPVDLKVTERAADSLTVSWEPPAGIGPGGANYYIGIDGVVDGVITGDPEAAVLSYTFEGLEADTEHTVRVRVAHVIGTDPREHPGDGVPATVTGRTLPAGAPGAPTDVRASYDPGPPFLTLTWAPPASTGGSPITGYEVVDADGKVDLGLSKDSRSAIFNKWWAPGVHTFGVRAENAQGWGPVAEVQVTIGGPAAPIAVPAPPGAPVAKVKGKKVTISWPAAAGAVDHYEVEIKAKGKGTVKGKKRRVRLRSAAPGLTVRKLRPGAYQVVVRAVNAAGVSSSSRKLIVRVRR